MASIVAGAGINVDATDPANPIVGSEIAPNADGGLTFATTATPSINMGLVFGGTWKTSHRKSVVSSGLLTGTFATQALLWEGEGHVSSGAAESGLPLFIEAKKTNYLTSTTEGQILGTYTSIYGGRLGDHAAHLFGARKVFAGTYSGSVLGIEGSVQKIDSSGAITQSAQVYMGWGMYNPGAGLNFAPDGMLGFAVEPRVGEIFAAFAAVERSDLSATFEYIVAASLNRNNANTFFAITGSGHASGGGRVRTNLGTAAAPVYSFMADPDTGVYSPAADQVGFSSGGVARLWVTTTSLQCTLPPKFLNGLAMPANGSTGNGIMMSTTANFGVFFGSGAPTLSAAKGSLYLRSDGTTTSTRAYINTDGANAWTAITTAA